MEAKLKHLEFIQAAISRMSTSSFLFKGWAITIAAALSAFGAIETRRVLLAVALFTTVLFWGLDGYYLWLERGFISLFQEVAAKDPTQVDFSMRIDKSHGFRRWLKTCLRHHLCAFYCTIIAVDGLAIVFIKKTL